MTVLAGIVLVIGLFTPFSIECGKYPSMRVYDLLPGLDKSAGVGELKNTNA